MELLIKTFHGLESVLAKELEELGATSINTLKRAVACEGNKEFLYKANLHLRTALRILVPISTFTATTEDELYKAIYDFDWSQYLTEKKTFAIDAVAFSELFKHSKYLALKTKDAIVDQFREKTGLRPSVNTENPDVLINVHVARDKFTVSLDSSGESLHRRGYRQPGHQAPLNEVLAAGMLKIAGWHKDIPLFDPMCGTGTILMEAAMLACNMPAGFKRKKFGFMSWADYDKFLWDKIYKEAEEKISYPRTRIVGSDIDLKAVDIAKTSSLDFRLNRQISISKAAFEEREVPFRRGMIIFNPPYGERLKKTDIFNFYKKIGSTLKQNYDGWVVWALSSNEEAIYRLGLHKEEKHILYNGALECEFLKYHMFEGKMKEFKARRPVRRSE